ncbi:MAG: aldehyde dehydrogenase family protein, partial [Spirochaetes bacterium]|nr:aldehyde dehydrogenase family protein [Spirochaetota bacterium]
QGMWRTIGENIAGYRSYPRVVGETGGKDFIVAHASADVGALATAMVRGAFEYQGQKCSAVSRSYIPKSIWCDLEDFMISRLETVTMGDVEDFSNFMNAVIDRDSFSKITGYIEYLKNSDEAEIIFGGDYDDSRGFFIGPVVAVTSDPHFRTMEEEIFGPVLTIYVYDDDRYGEILHLCDSTSPYGLTGAVFSMDRKAASLAERVLVNAAGNFYINDKPTGAVVGQQPFGGSRASGTNDKAGSILNMLRWTAPRVIKESFVPALDYRYPFMKEK